MILNINLKHILWLSSIVGHFPSSVSGNFNNYTFKWTSLALVYSICTSLFPLFLTLNLFSSTLQANGPPTELSGDSLGPWGNYISYLIVWTEIFMNIFLKSTSILNISKYLKLLRIISDSNVLPDFHCILEQFPFFYIFLYFLVFSISLAFWTGTIYFICSATSSEQFQNLSFLPQNLWLNRSLIFCSEFFYFSSIGCTILIIIFTCGGVLQNFEKFLKKHGQNFSQDSRAHFPDEFIKIKESFTLLNESVGDKIFFILFLNFSQIFSSLIVYLTNSNVEHLASSTMPLAYFGLFAYLGNYLKNTVNEGKEQIQLELLKILKMDLENIDQVERKKIKSVCELVKEWNWEFRSFNILSINFSLFPTFSGTLLTILIFIYQQQSDVKKMTSVDSS